MKLIACPRLNHDQLRDDAVPLCDLNAKLDPSKPESYRANRQLLKKNHTYLKMVEDAKKGREFNDIIVEYNTSDEPDKPLKVWGGQHRISAISEAANQSNRYHGFLTSASSNEATSPLFQIQTWGSQTTPLTGS
jgi:hypothetical protein